MGGSDLARPNGGTLYRMSTRTAMRFRLRCELQAAGGAPCPVRFSWIGPWRDAPTREQEARDEADAISRAEEIGWWFGKSLVACPRHAAHVETAHDPEEHPAHA